jgi:long-chain acyl-CoA synthetase
MASPPKEWHIITQAANAYSLAFVSLYDTLGPNTVEFCINHAEIPIIFAAPSHIPQLLTIADKCPSLKAIVSVDKCVLTSLGRRSVSN